MADRFPSVLVGRWIMTEAQERSMKPPRTRTERQQATRLQLVMIGAIVAILMLGAITTFD